MNTIMEIFFNNKMSTIPCPSSRHMKIIHFQYNVVIKSSLKVYHRCRRENFASIIGPFSIQFRV